jgi:hypothetical protein
MAVSTMLPSGTLESYNKRVALHGHNDATRSTHRMVLLEDSDQPGKACKINEVIVPKF